MSDSFVFPGLRDRILPGAWIERGLVVVAQTNIRNVALATAAAAVIAGAMTWLDGAMHERATVPLSQSPVAAIDDTQERAGAFTGHKDPTRHFDTSSAWRPAGGLSILTMTPSAAPTIRGAALPSPVVAAIDPPPTDTADADTVPLPRANPLSIATIPIRPKNAAPAVIATAPDDTAESKPSGLFGMVKRFFTPEEKQKAPVVASTPRTAIYDISARAVYMPNGETLEAHSGLGEWLDDPTSFHRKDRGVTPPATYKISLREKLFHGVRALRLTPVGDAKMYGRDGILAHSYLLGPDGQSNGCVSFKDYDKFLAAFHSGEVDQLIVVPNATPATAYAQANSSS